MNQLPALLNVPEHILIKCNCIKRKKTSFYLQNKMKIKNESGINIQVKHEIRRNKWE